MGFRDAARERQAGTAEMAQVSLGMCPDPRTHYETTVNKGSMSAMMMTGHLNVQYAKGYRLAHAFEQNGNTVTVFEHNHP